MIDEGVEQPAPHHNGSLLQGEDDFDRVMQESEEEMNKIIKQNPTKSVKDRILDIDAKTLKNPYIDNDPIFKKLKLFLSSFTIKADEAIQTKSTGMMVQYTYQVRLHE
jgi:hypothetical protein